jgi:hypothetical protein
MTQLARGMLPWQREAVKLQFRSYLIPANLPKPPRTFGHVWRSHPPGGWGMLGNDTKGDCVLAGAAHETMTWAWATNKPIPIFTDANVVEQYTALSGGHDAGLDPVATSKWRVTTGLTDADGAIHKLKAFGSVASRADVELATFLFGACGVGLALPDSAEQQFLNGKPWDDLSGEPNTHNGHYVPCVGRNSRGLLMVVTWGRVHAMTAAYFDKYAVGALAFFSREYLLATGKSPEVFDETQLDADLAALEAGGQHG